MKRRYTVGDYRDMMVRIRETLGDAAAISSDFIVGFCGETEHEFQETVNLLEECRFKNSFIFKYSERPGTKASDQLPDDIPFEVKNMAAKAQLVSHIPSDFKNGHLGILKMNPVPRSKATNQYGLFPMPKRSHDRCFYCVYSRSQN